MKLLPCPFCGKTDTLIMADDWDDLAVLDVEPTSDNSFAVTCDFTAGGCGAQGGYRKTPEDAEAAWNTRPSERLVDELIEACGQMLDIINESQGIVGWHLNGDVLLWSQCEQVQMMEDAVAAARAALTGKGE